MNPEAFRTFLTAIKESDIEELRIEAGETHISFKRSDVSAFSPVQTAPSVSKTNEMNEAAKTLTPIKSPMVGTFFHSDSAGRPPFVMEGNHIAPGRKIGIIETMKIMKDVNAPVKGKIIKILVKNGQPVEYGQELFMIDTEDVK
jgi:acetyl-CoA carboxylase biotin carboxyl carrier protein